MTTETIWANLAESIRLEKDGTTIPVPVEDIRALLEERYTSAEHFHIWSEIPCPPGQCRMETQGEPSDAQAALKAWSDYWDRDEGGNDMDAMRAALRAALSLRGAR